MQRERDTLRLARVIGDVLDPFTKSINLRVVYNNKEIRNGCDLRPSMVVNQPRVEVGGDDFQTFYTLVYHIYTQVSLLLFCTRVVFHFLYLGWWVWGGGEVGQRNVIIWHDTRKLSKDMNLDKKILKSMTRAKD